MDQEIISPYYRPTHVEKLLNVTGQTLYRWRKAGKGPKYAQLHTGTVRYFKESVDELVSKKLSQGNE